MPTERVTREVDYDDDAVVVDRGGSGLGTVLGIILVLLILAAVWWFALGPGTTGNTGGGSTTTNNGPVVNQPASS